MPSRRLIIALIVAMLLIGDGPAFAQYFGRNKVQHREFDFKVLSTEHFDVYYYPEQEAFVGHVARMAERWYARLNRLFGTVLTSRQPLILYASSADFRQTNTVSGDLGEGTGGVTEGLRRRIVMPSAGPLAGTDHVLGHELVHAFQYDMGGALSLSESGLMRLPLWMVEGLAEYLSIGSVDPQTAMWLRDAVVSNTLPTVRDLGNPRFFPYRFGHAFWAYVAGRWDDSTVMLLFNTAVKAGDAEQAIRIVLGMDSGQLSAEWHESIRKAYAGFLERQSPPSAFGRVIIDKSRGGGELNIAPALSPDGRRVAYMSERDLFSVDLYLADVDTGKVLHKLSSTATDPHFDSLQFIESAGSWSPDGRLFVQNAVVRGQGALLVFDTEKGRRIKEVVFKEFSELRNPVMAPDGRRVAFAALAGGLLDLWLYDMESGEKSRLTSDAFADLHPAFSPDGRQLAFITDRFSTTLDTLTFGDCRLAIYDFADKSIREVAGHPRGMQTNPQWAPDGRTLYFVSTVNGSPDVHRVDLATGELRQVTALQTGVAGITPLSPSISVAQRTGRLAFAARQGGGYAIYAADDAGVLAGEPPREPLLNAATVSLPPSATTPREPDRQLANSTRGLPRAALPDSKPYKARLGLDFVGQPTIGVGVNQFGAYAGGSTSLFFSDMLGNHNLGVMAQINGGIQDIAGLVQYANLSKRFDWAVGVQHIPYITGGTFNRYRDTVDGLPVIVDDFLLERQTSTGTVAIGSLPFNRARRLEVQAGYRRIGFSLQRRKQYYLEDGSSLGEEKEDLGHPYEPLHLFSAAAALVHDTSLFGPTSPITGSRARLEVSPSFGTIQYTSVLADARAYFMPVRPLTFAFRAMHVGRYGIGSEDERFRSLFVGYPDLIRGYGGISGEDCSGIGPQATACPSYDRLFGSRMVVANAELRAPLVGLFRGKLEYGRVPVEVALFADAGVAWTSADKAAFLGGDRAWVRSAGVAVRVNVFGIMVVETAYARPFDRLSNGWVWSWNFTPGF